MMQEIFLIPPSHEYKQEYLEMMNEWLNTGEHLVPFVLRMDSSHFEKMWDQEKPSLIMGEFLNPRKLWMEL